MIWQKATLIGVGLLGGSMGLALKQRKLAGSVFGYARRAETVQEAMALGAVDNASSDIRAAVDDADLVVFCTPVSQMASLADQMLPALKRGAIVTDVGSVKRTVVQDLETRLDRAGVKFVGSHPMAGSEKTGVAAAKAELYEGAVCVITPTAETEEEAIRSVEQLWRGVGCRLLLMSPEEHDLLVSRSSHLPHLLAVLLANFVLSPEFPPDQARLCATGFRDTTRVASGSPEMWRDIALANGDNLCQALDHIVSGLEAFKNSVKRQDSQTIMNLFAEAKRRRDAWVAGQGARSTGVE